jgi:SAM-dependent methyltransferase
VSANTYQRLHAAHYDRIYADKPYAEEARFVADRLPAGARVLDLACGTARHAVELARLGFDVTGVDYSADLLESARRNIEAAGVAVSVHEQDMRALDVEPGSFDAVTCLFDSIGYPQDNAGVLTVLRGAAQALRPGGTLVCEYLHAPAMIAGFAPVKVRSWELPDGELLRVSRTQLDHAAAVMRVQYDLLVLRDDGTFERAEEEQANRYFTTAEFAVLLEQAGLEVREQVAAYRDDPAIGEDTFHVLAAALRPA